MDYVESLVRDYKLYMDYQTAIDVKVWKLDRNLTYEEIYDRFYEIHGAMDIPNHLIEKLKKIHGKVICTVAQMCMGDDLMFMRESIKKVSL